MFMRSLLPRGGHVSGALAAVMLTLLALASASGATQRCDVLGPPATPAVADDGSGTGMPPMPGPTDPNGP
jgi:hypothetical protein